MDGDQGRKNIVPLDAVNHADNLYIQIEKNLYVEHEHIAALSDDEVLRIRSQLDMRVSGSNVPKPCISFAHFNFDDALLSTISKAGFSTPTPIQQQAVPVALSGRDVIAVSKTGSGKTAAFLWPMMVHMMDQPELEKGDGPIGLILAPTRELATQIYTESKKFGKTYNLKSAVVYGGASKTDQFKELRAGFIEIVVATPGRLIDLVKMKAINLMRVSFLVLDEADRMFDLGFEPQVRSICNAIRPDRQTLLFSATFAKRVEKLARDVLTNPVRISIGNVGASNTDIEQRIVVLQDDSYKWSWLTQRLNQFVAAGTVIIFISRKAGVVELSENLNKHGFPNTPFHGDLAQHERDKVISDLKRTTSVPNPATRILVATDVAARGLDVKTVRTVVNFDVARDIDSHVHRVGRTGRAGMTGTAYTLITAAEDRFAAELVGNLEESLVPVPADLMALAMKNGRFRAARGAGGGGSRGSGRGGGTGFRG
ncbi:P-loop containing nucleoside triphosphate hydrolase protein, partial [Chytriomyces sp. MP71]